MIVFNFFCFCCFNTFFFLDKLNYDNHSHRTDVSKSPVIGTNINDLPTLTHNKSFVKKTGTIGMLKKKQI